MKKKFGLVIIATVACLCVGCHSGKNTDVQSDKKPETTESTVDDAIGEDSEIQMTTDKNTEQSSDEPTASTDEGTRKEESSKEEETTYKKEQETTTKKEQETTTKKEETTTKKPAETTTKKPAETTTKKPTPTTSKEETTTKKEQETTTKKEEISTAEQYTTGYGTSGNTRGDAITITEFSVSDTEKSKAKSIVSQIITSKMSDYECVKVIHDYLVKYVNYDYEGLKSGAVNNASHKSHSAEGALCYNLAVCDGYAKAFQLLCAQVGIEAHMMYGKAGNATAGYESHAWNVVKINGAWYQVDCTWDDPLINNEIITDGSNITYKYFLLTDSEMYVDHILDKDQTPNEKTCTDTLFKGLGETLSLEAAMGEPGVIVTNAKSFYLAITEYTSKKQWNCFIAVPQSVTITEDEIEAAVIAGAETLGYNGFSYGYGCTYMNVGSYVVYEFDITVTP